MKSNADQDVNNNNNNVIANLNNESMPNVGFKSNSGNNDPNISLTNKPANYPQNPNPSYTSNCPPAPPHMNNWNGPSSMYSSAGPTNQYPISGGMSNQNQQQIWMQRPNQVDGCPPGLEYLTMVDQILVHQQIELLEVFTNWETKNKYQIKNSVGQQVYYAAEESDVCARQCCGPQRGFVMHITDNMGNEVIRAIRDFKCCAGPCCQCCAGIPMCAQELLVESPPGCTIGRIIQQSSCLEPSYAIQNSNFETVLQIRGPVCICQGPCCTWDQEFKVYSSDMSSEVGRISKQWSGFVHEYFTDADNFGVSFPIDLDVKMKATMIGAVFLIDFIFFENNQQNQNS